MKYYHRVTSSPVAPQNTFMSYYQLQYQQYKVVLPAIINEEYDSFIYPTIVPSLIPQAYPMDHTIVEGWEKEMYSHTDFYLYYETVKKERYYLYQSEQTGHLQCGKDKKQLLTPFQGCLLCLPAVTNTFLGVTHHTEIDYLQLSVVTDIQHGLHLSLL